MVKLRPIDYIYIGLFLLLQIALVYFLHLDLIGYIETMIAEIITGVVIKLVNMYRMDPQEKREKKREDGLSGLFC